MNSNPDRPLRLEEAAVRAGLSVKHLRREVDRLGIRKERFGPRSVFIRESEVDRLIELRKAG